MENPEGLRSTLLRAIDNARRATSDFDLNPEYQPPENRILKPAAVLLIVTEDGQLVLTKRSSQLNHHPGQIAFAGGRKDDTDRDITHTALREAQEEIGLDPETVTVLGELPPHDTVTNYQVTPIVGIVPSSKMYTPEPGEVAEVFSVPIGHVLDWKNYRIEGRHWRGQRRQYFTVPYGPYYIWGATARILRGLAEGAL